MTRTFGLPVIAALVGVFVSSGVAVAAHSGVVVPKASRSFSSAIEGLAPYQPESFCRHSVEPGVTDFAQLLTTTYSDTAIVSELRPCGSEPTPSEHMDGRALDWGVDHRNAAQRKDGKELLSWLFATDAYGNHDAMLRRLGIMYIIWNKQIWGTWDQRWEPYACSGTTACHVNHMHFSFGWAGAEAKTSWFTGQVSPVLPPPYPVLRSLKTSQTLTVTTAEAQTQGQFLLGRGMTYDVTIAGVWQQDSGSKLPADAVCAKAGKTWSPTGDPASFEGISEWVSTDSDDSPCNTNSHSYRMTITPTAKTQPVLQLDTHGASHPHGQLTVTIRRVK